MEQIFLNSSSYLTSLLILPDWSFCKHHVPVSAPTVRGGEIPARIYCTTQKPFTSSVLAKAPWTESWPQRLRVPAGHTICLNIEQKWGWAVTGRSTLTRKHELYSLAVEHVDHDHTLIKMNICVHKLNLWKLRKFPYLFQKSVPSRRMLKRTNLSLSREHLMFQFPNRTSFRKLRRTPWWKKEPFSKKYI